MNKQKRTKRCNQFNKVVHQMHKTTLMMAMAAMKSDPNQIPEYQGRWSWYMYDVCIGPMRGPNFAHGFSDEILMND